MGGFIRMKFLFIAIISEVVAIILLSAFFSSVSHLAVYGNAGLARDEGTIPITRLCPLPMCKIPPFNVSFDFIRPVSRKLTANFIDTDVSTRTDSWDEKNPLSGVKRARFEKGTNLRYLRANSAFLVGAKMSGVDLTGASLQEANMIKTDLSRTILTSANLSGANLEHALLAGIVVDSATNMTNANLAFAHIKEVRSSSKNSAKTEENYGWVRSAKFWRIACFEPPAKMALGIGNEEVATELEEYFKLKGITKTAEERRKAYDEACKGQ
jgi:hypothetical protein